MKNVKVTFVSAAFALCGCGMMGGGGGLMPGGLGGPRVPPLYGPYEVKGDLIKLGLGDREMRAQVAIEVPPDKAYAPIDISARGPNFDAAAAQVKKAMDEIKKLGSTAGCGFKITGYVPPNSSDNKVWKAAGSVEFWADMAGQDPEARIARSNTCFKALHEWIIALPKDDGKVAEFYSVDRPSLYPAISYTVENLEKHRDALVKQADDRLAAVAKANAKMWDHADMQCTSAGIITVASANSHSVTLQLEMYCPVSTAEPASAK